MSDPFGGSRQPGAFRVGGVSGAARAFLGAALARPLSNGNPWLAMDVVAHSATPPAAAPSQAAPSDSPTRRP